MSELKEQIVRGAKWLVVLKVTSIPIRLVASIVLVRYLAKEQYGVYNIVLNIGTMMIYVTSCAVQHVLARYVPEYIEKKQYREVNQLTMWLLLARALVVAATVTILGMFWGSFAQFFKVSAWLTPYVWLILAILFLQRTTEVFGLLLHTALLDFKSITIHDGTRTLLFTAGIIAVSTLNQGLHGLLLLLLLSEVYTGAFYGITAGRHWTGHARAAQTSSPIEWRRIVPFALYNIFYTAGGVVSGASIDSFVIARCLGVREVAAYTFAIGLLGTVHSVNPAVLMKPVINNAFIRKYEQERDAAVLSRGFLFIWKMGLFVGLPVMAALCALARPTVTYVYKPDFLDSVPLFYLFGTMYLFRYMGTGLMTIISTLERVRFLLVYNLIGALNLVFALVLVRYWGAIGVGLATSGADVTWALFLLWVVVRKTKVSVVLLDAAVLRIVANTVAAIAVLVVLSHFIGGVLSLLAVGLAGGVVYLGLSFINKPFSEEERTMVNSAFGRKLLVF